jgi:acyl-CoA reductase-like NAD-dependent aldehyde dehydrogenase/nicotinamidase-related amidase
MAPCLISLDLQDGYLEDPGLEPAAGRLLAGAAAWLERFRERGLPIVHVRTTVRPEGSALPHWDERRRLDFAPGAAGWRFAAPAAPLDGEPVVEKTHYSAFQSGRLLQLLEELDAGRVVVIGVHLHGCVRSTALDASAAGLSVDIADDATASSDPPHAAATRRWMSTRGFRFLELDEWEAEEGPRFEQPAVRPDRAAVRAAAAFRGWSASSAELRVAALEPLAALLRDEAPSLARMMASEIGKPVRDGEAEVAYAADLVEESLSRVSETTLRTEDGEARRVPHGPTLLVTPWNNPIAIPVGKIVPALAFGNTAVWKPSPQAAGAVAELHELISTLDLPAGALERVEGGAPEVAALLTGDRIEAVSLTGSLEAGRAIQDLCARRLIPLQAELGANNAAVVCGEADLERAANEIATAAFSFAGQRCTATRRAIVVEHAHEPFASALRARIEELRPGDPRSPDTDFGPVVSHRAAARIEATIARAESEGATAWRPRWAGGPAFAELRARLPFVPPTLIEGAAPESEIVCHETFGPVLVLIPAATVEEAIERCNEVPQGLAASVHAGSEREIADFVRNARAGLLEVNRSTAGAAASLPFGGLGLSGVGPPEHGEGDVEFHTRWQTVYTRPPARGRVAAGDGGRPEVLG